LELGKHSEFYFRPGIDFSELPDWLFWNNTSYSGRLVAFVVFQISDEIMEMASISLFDQFYVIKARHVVTCCLACGVCILYDCKLNLNLKCELCENQGYHWLIKWK
jgi:hypothetical protein